MRSRWAHLRRSDRRDSTCGRSASCAGCDGSPPIARRSVCRSSPTRCRASTSSSSASRRSPTTRSTARRRPSTAASSRDSSCRCSKRESDPVVQSLIMPAVEYQPARRFNVQTPKLDAGVIAPRSPARAAAGMGLDRRRAVRARRRPCVGDGGRCRWPPTATRRSIARTGGTCPRNFRSRTPAAAGGRRIARASRCYWEDEIRRARGVHVLGPPTSRRTACRTRWRRWASRVATRLR